MATPYSQSMFESQRRHVMDERRSDPRLGRTTDIAPVAGLPVLARIPEISPKSLSAASRSYTASHAQDIRFDPPQPRNQRPRHRAVADPMRRSDISPPRTATAAEAHKEFPRSAPIQSKVLPTGNPFEIPQAKLQDRFAPVVQFLLLSVLFTAAGTSILMIGRKSGGQAVESSATNLDSAIAVPTAVTQSPVVEPTAVPETAPTAVGPANDVSRTRPGSTSWSSFANGPSVNAPTTDNVPAVARTEARPNSVSTPTNPPEHRERLPLSNPAAAANQQANPYPTTGVPQAVLPTAGHAPLPQVRTFDPPPAFAQLRGDIGTVPPR